MHGSYDLTLIFCQEKGLKKIILNLEEIRFTKPLVTRFVQSKSNTYNMVLTGPSSVQCAEKKSLIFDHELRLNYIH